MKQLLFALLLPFTVFGQKTYHQGVSWLRYQWQYSITPKTYWSNELESRRFLNPSVQNQLIFHSRMHRKIGAWDLAAGITYSQAYASIPQLGFRRMVPEVRPVMEGSYDSKLKKISIQNRLRIDHRFFEEDPNQSLLKNSRYVLRARYRLQVRVPLKETATDGPTVVLRIADEIMVRNTDEPFDQNRIYITTDFFLSKNFRLEAGYIHLYQPRQGTEDIFQRHIIRLSVLHRSTSHYPSRNTGPR